MLDLRNTKKVIDSVDVVLSDCDGVLWTGDSVVSGAPDAINKLKAMGKKIFYVTNNSYKSRKEYVHKFLGLGYHVVDDEIFAASNVTAEYLQTKYNYQGKVTNGQCLQLNYSFITVNHVMKHGTRSQRMADIPAWPARCHDSVQAVHADAGSSSRPRCRRTQSAIMPVDQDSVVVGVVVNL